MAPPEALKILGLTPAASPEQIRQAYRDLVKVWHPDRFGTDARLRAKAEEQLKAINAAFDSLEAADFRTDTPAPESSSVHDGSARYSPSPGPSRDRVARGWLYVACFTILAAVIGFAVHAVGVNQVHTSTPIRSQPAITGPVPAPRLARRTQPHETNTAEPGTPAFKVWSLPQSQTDRLQLACSRHTPGTEAYRECVSAQLDAITHRPGAANMTGMNSGERDAAEAACQSARVAGEATFGRCLQRQLAELSTQPIRPDLSTLSAADRESIRTACSAASRRGAAEYDRCLIRFARTLSEVQASPAAP